MLYLTSWPTCWGRLTFRPSRRVIHAEVCARQCLGKMLKCIVELKVLTKVERLLRVGAAWAHKRDYLSLLVSKAAPRNVNSSNYSSLRSMLCFPEVAQSAGFQFLMPQSIPFGILQTTSCRVHMRCVTGWGAGLRSKVPLFGFVSLVVNISIQNKKNLTSQKIESKNTKLKETLS